MKVRHVDVARLGWQAPRIDAGAAMMEFVAAPVRQRETVVALADASEFGRQVRQLVRDQMHDLALTLDAALHGDHAGGQDDAALAVGLRQQKIQVLR
jgi:hypothetical protein